MPDEVPANGAAVETVWERQELADAVGTALAGLSGPLREVLVLRHYEGLSFEQMGRLLGVPASTLKSRFTVALGRVRSRLYDLGYGAEGGVE